MPLLLGPTVLLSVIINVYYGDFKLMFKFQVMFNKIYLRRQRKIFSILQGFQYWLLKIRG